MVNTNSERTRLLLKIYQYDFAIDEIVLFLDTHPNDKNALNDYNRFIKERNEIVKEYVEKYGPIQIEGENKGASWQWINEPWPWQKEVWD